MHLEAAELSGMCCVAPQALQPLTDSKGALDLGEAIQCVGSLTSSGDTGESIWLTVLTRLSPPVISVLG